MVQLLSSNVRVYFRHCPQMYVKFFKIHIIQAVSREETVSDMWSLTTLPGIHHVNGVLLFSFSIKKMLL